MADPVNGPMVSEVTICNQALTWLGSTPITSLQDDSNTAQWCRVNYPFLRDAVLAERMWTFATFRDVRESNDMDAWGQEYVYNLEPDWLAIYRVCRDVSYSRNATAEYRIEGNQIVTKHSRIFIWGLTRVTDTKLFHPMFVQALAARIAADAAIPITENRELQADMWNLYAAKLQEAAARDGQQGSNDYITQRQLTDVRYSGGYG